MSEVFAKRGERKANIRRYLTDEQRSMAKNTPKDGRFELMSTLSRANEMKSNLPVTNLWEIERELVRSGIRTICGVDEAGRGPLAGPVYAAAVILPLDLDIPELNDSKKLSADKRNRVFDLVINAATAYGVAFADHKEIDALNILNATYLAMNRAIEMLEVIPDIALIDGNRNSGITFKSRCIVKGDSKSASIAAASVLAKVSRDRYMEELAKKYPNYAFEKHKGYGTKLHYAKLEQHGISDIHRRSFLKLKK